MTAYMVADFIRAPCGGDLICIGVIVLVIVLASTARSSPRRCPRCHELTRPRANYCAQCGAQLRR